MVQDPTLHETQVAEDGVSAERSVVSASREVEPDVLPPGTKLVDGRFEIVCRLGQGGMGVVYEAFDRERGERVALKTLSHVDPAAIYRLKHEFRALLDVHHANLVRLHELFADGDTWFFTMELVDGKPFDTWLFEQIAETGPDPEVSGLQNALAQLVAAVRAIHAAGQLHRDLKPSNVLIDAHGRVVVLDFGLVASARGKQQTADDDMLMGTPAYMAPEQAARAQLSEATDFYAIGVMLFEVLTGGSLPFEGALGKVLFTKQTLNAPHPRSIAPDAPRELSDLCQQLLAREPGRRPSGSAIAERLGPLRASRISALPEPAPKEKLGLVGRERELSELRRAYQASVEGTRPVVLWLRGESGIGKSALCEHFLAGLKREGNSLVLSGRCFERESMPFKAFDAIVDELCRQLRRLPDADAAPLLPRETPALARLFPVLKRVPVVAALAEREAADAHDLRRRGFSALGELLARIRNVAPVVLHVDDLQWSDADSNLLLQHLLRQADAPRILCILAQRDEHAGSKSPLSELHERLRDDLRLDVRTLELGPLPDRAARQLAGDPSAQADNLLRDARGNPFLLGELTRHARSQSSAPRTVQEALNAHLRKLPADARRMLELLALCGRPMRLPTIAQAAGLSTGAHDAFERLRRSRLARRASAQLLVECYHDRVREAVVETLSAEQRAAHHRALASVLSLAEDDPEQLALHFEGGGMAQEAAVQAARAGNRALAALAFDQAARFLEKAQLLGSFDEAEQQRLRVARAEALGHGGQGAIAGEAYLAAAEHASDANEARRLLRHGAEQFLYAGHLERGRALLGRALGPWGFGVPRSAHTSMALLAFSLLRTKLQPPRFRARAQHTDEELERLSALRYGVASLTRNDPARGALLSFRYARLAAKLGEPKAWAHVLSSRASSAHYGLSDPSEVPEALRQSDAIYAHVDDPWGHAQRYLAEAAYRLFHCHDPAATLAAAERCWALHEASVIPYASYDRPLCRMMMIMGRMRLGQLRVAARELPALIDDARARNDLGLLPNLLGLPAIARIAVEDLTALDRELKDTWHALEQMAHATSVQHMALWLGEMVLCLYRGEHERAWERCEREWARLDGSPSRRVPAFSQAARVLRGFTALHVAAQSQSSSQRESLLRTATEDAGALERIGGGSIQLSRCPSAGVACARGDRASAIAALRKHSQGLERDPLYRSGLERALGLLVGGDEGHELVTNADEALRAGGALRPDRFALLLHPPLFGLEADALDPAMRVTELGVSPAASSKDG